MKTEHTIGLLELIDKLYSGDPMYDIVAFCKLMCK